MGVECAEDLQQFCKKAKITRPADYIVVDNIPCTALAVVRLHLYIKSSKDWTRGHVLVNARWVMLITLINTRAETLTDILSLFCHSEEIVAKHIEKDSGEGLCFVIDGLDEYQPQDKKKSPIYQLLNKAILPKAMVIVSSRPAATEDLKWEKLTTQRIEVMGFTREQVLEYIDCFPFGSHCSDSDKSINSSTYPVQLRSQQGYKDGSSQHYQGTYQTQVKSRLAGQVPSYGENGAQVDLQKENGWCALMSASQNGHTEVVKILLENGAQVDLQNNGFSALMIASLNGHAEVVGGGIVSIPVEYQWSSVWERVLLEQLPEPM